MVTLTHMTSAFLDVATGHKGRGKCVTEDSGRRGGDFVVGAALQVIFGAGFGGGGVRLG